MEKKKTYKKPEITRVELKPEEAVLTACKTSSAGPGRRNGCSAAPWACVAVRTPGS